MNQYKIAFCRFPGDQWEYHGLATWMMQTTVVMSRDPSISEVVPIVTCDTPITMSRNLAVKRALAEECDYILMVDSDMVPDYLVGRDPFARPFWDTAWAFMLNRHQKELELAEEIYGLDRELKALGGVPVEEADRIKAAADDTLREMNAIAPATIAAPYCGPPPYEVPMVFRWKDNESDCPDPNFRLEMIEREEAAYRSGIEEVPALATGLILYDTRVFARLKPPWFDYEWGDAERTIKATTEDVFQTRNAHLIGLPQYVLWDSWAMHAKTKLVGKPRPLAADQVHASLSEAVLRGHKANGRVRMVNRHDRPRPANGEPSPAVPEGPADVIRDHPDLPAYPTWRRTR